MSVIQHLCAYCVSAVCDHKQLSTAGPCGTFKWLGSLQEWSTNNGLIILFFNQNVKSEHDNIIIYFSSGSTNIRPLNQRFSR